MADVEILKRIFVVSLDSAQKHKAAAILFKDKRLVITHCSPVGGGEQWREKLLEEIESKAKDGFVVTLEDRSACFSPYGASCCFEDVEGDRTLMQHAFDWWFSLRNSGSLIIEPSIQRFAINAGEGGLLDIRHDDKGRIVYHPNWMQFNGGHKAMLLCVISAMMEEPQSDRWVRAMLAAWPKPPQEPNPFTAWGAITVGKTLADAEEFERRVREQNAK